MHRICVIKSRTIKITVVMFLVAILLTIGFNGAASAQVFFGYHVKKTPIYSVNTQEKKVAISFDAAWGADMTQDIIDTLKEYDSTATFFLVGFWIDKNPEVVKAIQEANLEIGTHSNTHPDFTTLSKEKMLEEVTNANEGLKKITGTSPNLFRFPYGAYNDTAINIVEGLGMKAIQWDVDSLDWKGSSPEEITMRILNNVKNGSIILCHNNADNIVPALTMILQRLQMQGYKIVSVGELIYQTDYSVDRNGVQHSTAREIKKVEVQGEVVTPIV